MLWDYKKADFAKGERCELIYGNVYMMAASSLIHQGIFTIPLGEFYNFFREKPCKVYPAPFDARLLYQEDASYDTIVQPEFRNIGK